MLKTFVIGLVILALLVVLAFAGLSIYSRKAPDLRSSDGALRPCPDRPNCVNSETRDDAHRVEPLYFSGPAPAAMARARQAVEAIGGEVLQQDPGYLWARFETPLFRFVDDLELRVDPNAGLIHVRSASRVGYSDGGSNRERVERLRAAYAER